MNIRLFVVTFDGVETHYCGVGSITQYLLAAVPSLTATFSHDGIRLDVHVLYSELPRSGFPRSTLAHKRSKRMAAEGGVRLVPVPHGHEPANPFGNRRTWPHSCRFAADYIRAHLDRVDLAIVLAADTPYAGLPALLAPSSRSFHVIWIAHSTGRCWRTDSAKPNDPEREEWETKAIWAAERFENAWVGATSRFMKQHLIEECGVPPERILDGTVGVDENYLCHTYMASRDAMARMLARHGVPVDRPLFVAFGRAQWYKGLDLALRVGRHLQQESDVVPVLLAKDDGTPEAAVTSRALSGLARTLPHCVFLTQFNFDLPKWLMAWRRTAAVGVFSRREPFGLIPSEYRALGPDGGVLVVQPSGGLVEQVTDGEDGLTALEGDERGTAIRCLGYIARADSLRLNVVGRLRMRRDYNLSHNLISLIRRLTFSQ